MVVVHSVGHTKSQLTIAFRLLGGRHRLHKAICLTYGGVIHL